MPTNNVIGIKGAGFCELLEHLDGIKGEVKDAVVLWISHDDKANIVSTAIPVDGSCYLHQLHGAALHEDIASNV